MLSRRRFLVGSASLAGLMLARRLLGGIVGSALPANEQAAWTRYGGNPIMTATVAWETDDCIQEASVHYVSGWKMWYRGGYEGSTCAVGYATSSDGLAWTKYASNPVLGQGGSGVAGNVVQPNVMRIGSTWWMYYNDITQAAHLATSSDGISWTGQSLSISLPASMTWWGNRYVWLEAGTYYGLWEAGASAVFWRTYLYTSADGQTWSIGNGGAALSSLQVSASGAYGGPWMPAGQKVNGLYQLWYHAAPAGSTDFGNLPTQVYHATSSDLINWTQVTPNPIMGRSGTGYEIDQTADPHVIEVSDASYLYWSSLHVTGGFNVAAISAATFPGSLATLCSL